MQLWVVQFRTVLLLLLLLLSCVSRVWLCATPETAAHQAPPSLGLSRQEHWSGLPFPSPMQESEKWKWSRSVVSDSVWPHRQQPTRLPCPWDSPGKSTRVGCHSLPSPIQSSRQTQLKKDKTLKKEKKRRENLTLWSFKTHCWLPGSFLPKIRKLNTDTWLLSNPQPIIKFC